MELRLQIKLPESLYIRNPESTQLGRNILQQSVVLMVEQGFDAFNFKKLATKIGTTEAGIYRYFENKQQVLMYLTSWYWNWLSYQIYFHTNNMSDPFLKLEKIIALLSDEVEDDITTSHINEVLLCRLISIESVKSAAHALGNETKKLECFNAYIELCQLITSCILACNPSYPFAKMMASTVVEISMHQRFLLADLPVLLDKELKSKKKTSGQQLISFVTTSLRPR